MGQVSRCVCDALLVLGLAWGLASPIGAWADDVGGAGVVILESDDSNGSGGGYADADADDCASCHDEDSKYPVLSILATKHAVKGDERTPLASSRECQTCHGPANDHVESELDDPPPVAMTFGLDEPIQEQNDVCLGCHKGGQRLTWAGSTHDRQNMACVSCHTIHAQEDAVLVKNINPMLFLREGQARVCFQCHPETRAQIQRRVSSHPLREGKMDCSSCHAVHGAIADRMLNRPTLNETCFQCHAEKRGPFLYEHAPVREDCAACHTPHGSNHPVLLKTRVPQLCQQCHMAVFHPSEVYTGPDTANGIADIHQLERGCMNCHQEVHGSNHPSGVRWTR